ncbi:hypothetical protein BH20GEM2_BH20GEM2_04360 [soil metagenome]
MTTDIFHYFNPENQMKSSHRAILLTLLPLALAGCESFGKAMTTHTDVVARAAGRELTVDEAARMLAANPQIPADPQVVEALADFWTDYTLLAEAVASDPTLASLDVEEFVKPEREQAVIMKLRDRAIRPDTSLSEAEIQRRWASEGPGMEIKARHVLLRVPPEATPAQRDSVQRLAESLRQRAAGGADFVALATEYSQDPASKERGGDLGYFGRGRMVAPFEEAAFELQPGQVSRVVESPFGYHVIKVEDRRQPELGAQREEFRSFLVQKSQQDAETRFVDSLATAAAVEVQPGAARLVKEMAEQPNVRLRGRAAERTIASYKGGALTVGEFSDYMRSLPPGALGQAGDQQIEELITNLTRRELLLAEARRRKIGLSEAERDSLRTQAQQAIQQLLQMTGLNQRTPAGGAGAAARQAEVNQLMEALVTGQQQVPPLGRLGLALREDAESEVNEAAFPAVIEKLKSLRASQPQVTPPATGQPQPTPAPPQQPQAVPQPAAPDTAAAARR